MKFSQYNLVFSSNGSTFIYNAFRDSFAEVDQEMIDFIENAGQTTGNAPGKAVVDELIRCGFLIEDAKDEFAELKVRNRLGRYFTTSLGVTIAPTLMCNFECDYCFERNKTKAMTPETVDAVYEFLLDRLRGKTSFGITWYGGEPLLALDVIRTLTKKLVKICGLMKINFSADIISNGYLMTEEVAKELAEELRVKSWQITIDGPPEIHDKRRPLKDGGKTYETCFSNLLKTHGFFNNVILRINIDKRNQKHVPKFFKAIQKAGIGDKVNVSLAKVDDFTEVCQGIGAYCYSAKDFAKLHIGLNEKAHELGIDTVHPPRLFTNYCTADCVDTFVIDSYGNVSKCWNCVGDEEKRIGTVFSETFNDNLTKWLSLDPLEREDCVKCKYLPICMGGCPYNAIYAKDKDNCQDTIYMLEESLLAKHHKDKNINKQRQ